jgi:hypothetical protein
VVADFACPKNIHISTIAIAVFLKTGYAVNQNLDPVSLKTHYGIQLKTINNNPSQIDSGFLKILTCKVKIQWRNPSKCAYLAPDRI